MAHSVLYEEESLAPPGGGRDGEKRRSPRQAPRRSGDPYALSATAASAVHDASAGALNGGAVDGTKRDGWLRSTSKMVSSTASSLYCSIFKRPVGGWLLHIHEDEEKLAVDNFKGQADMLSPSAAEAESMEAADMTISEVESWMLRMFPREEAERWIASLRSYIKENRRAEDLVHNIQKAQQHRPELESAQRNPDNPHRWSIQEAVDVAKSYMEERVSAARVALNWEKSQKIPIVSNTKASTSAIGYTVPGDLERSKKRRCTVLDDDGYTSGGVNRRLRHRSSLHTLSPASGFQKGKGFGMYPSPQRIFQMLRNVDTKKRNNGINAQHREEATRGSAMRSASVSVQQPANEIFRKILETLDMMTPPNEKSLETEMASLPTKLTTSDKACQTMQSWKFPPSQDLEEAGPPSGRAGCNVENDLSESTNPVESTKREAPLGAEIATPASISRHSVELKLASGTLGILQDLLHAPTRGDLVDNDRFREDAFELLVSLVHDVHRDFIDLIVTSFLSVFLDMADDSPSLRLAIFLEELVTSFFSSKKRIAYIIGLSHSHQIRIGLVLLRSVGDEWITRRSPGQY